MVSLRVVVTWWALGGVAAAAPSTAAHAVADLDARIASAQHIGRETAGLVRQRDEAIDRWLREQLAALHGDDDGSIAATKAIQLEATRRTRTTVAREARDREAEMITHRMHELDPDIAAGRWYTALSQLAAWDRPDIAAPMLARIRTATDEAARTAPTVQERFLYARMHRWLGDALTDDPAMVALAHTKVAVTRSPTGCTIPIAVASQPDGTALDVQLALGDCAASIRNDSTTRTGSYSVPVLRERDEAYTVDVPVSIDVPTYHQECSQVDKDIGIGGDRDTIRVAECHQVSGTDHQTATEHQTRYRRVQYTDQESHEESYTVAIKVGSIETAMSLAITGDNQTVTINQPVRASLSDEQWTRQHGDSHSFRGDFDAALRTALAAETEKLVQTAVAEWKAKRARARLDSRAHAIEAVRIDPSVAPLALPVIKLDLDADGLVALIAGEPTLHARALPPVVGLELPPADPSLVAELGEVDTKLDELRQEGNRDGFAAMGIGFTTREMRPTARHFSLEFQTGYVPTFTATSNVLMRFELDVQMFGSRDPQTDISLRPELGLRAGPLELSAVLVAGVQVTVLYADNDFGSDGRAYLGYGAHFALKPGKLLVDALIMREYQALDPVPVATRADLVLGWKIKPAFYSVLRARAVAQTDVQDAWSSDSHSLSVTIGGLSQY